MADIGSREAPPLTKHELASKLVQEIAVEREKVPEEYLHKNGFPEAIDAPDLWRDNLLLDFSLLSSFSTQELAKLRSALSEWGCFQVINHGIESSFLEELIAVSRQFFALPLDEKLKCSALPNNSVEGYGNDTVAHKSQTPNWNDRLFLLLYPKEKVMQQCWPQKPEKFREMIDEYTNKLTTVNKGICKAMARSLDLQEDSFLTQWKHMGPSRIRFNYYPPCPFPDRVLGSKPHTDSTTVTYILPDEEVENLHILKDDQWFKVSVFPGALFINLGDLGEVMTNGVFKSAVHRVSTDSAKDRISVATLFIPEYYEEVGPVSELVSGHQPPVYKKFNISEYMQIFLQSFTLGSRAVLDAFKV